MTKLVLILKEKIMGKYIFSFYLVYHYLSMDRPAPPLQLMDLDKMKKKLFGVRLTGGSCSGLPFENDDGAVWVPVRLGDFD